MPTHAEVKILPYTAKQMYDLVADVEKYPQFLPWCIACRILERNDQEIKADLIVGYKFFKDQFVSKVILNPYESISVSYQEGALRHLSNHWKFKDVDNARCEVDFFVDFELQNSLLQSAVELFFNEAVKIMIHAFEKRADQLYR